MDAVPSSDRPIEAGARDQRRARFVLVTGALALAFQYYVPRLTTAPAISGFHPELLRLAWWTTAVVLAYFMAPLLLVRFGLGEGAGDYGLSFGSGGLSPRRIAALVGAALAIVWLASWSSAFTSRYPLFRLGPGEVPWSALLAWEAIYAFQFVATEFFFRGYLIHGLHGAIGELAVFVAMVPYVMAHFGKPWPETVGAVVAGVVLGRLSLTTRTIGPGLAVHLTVALGMDALALHRRGLL